MIIQSLVDNDLYKFTMMQAVFNHFPDAYVEYEFKCRSGEDLSPYYDEIVDELTLYCGLEFSKIDLYKLEYPFIKKEFLKYLKSFQPNGSHIKITKNPFTIKVEGPWLETILFEVPILAIVNEVYFNNKLRENDKLGIPYARAIDLLFDKINLVRDLKGFKFADFGTRRRFSGNWHRHVVQILADLPRDRFIGSSNVDVAFCTGVPAIGTMAHEWIQAGQVLSPSLRDSQKFMLQKWNDEYKDQLSVALSDTIGSDAFLKDFSKYFAQMYNGVRQDSGDPYEFAEKIIAHYEKMYIDPRTKHIIFSDNLNFPKAIDLFKKFNDRINVSFGIGTNITNDIPGFKPISIVMKLQKCNGKPVAKISDEVAKAQCQDKEYLQHIKEVFEIYEN